MSGRASCFPYSSDEEPPPGAKRQSVPEDRDASPVPSAVTPYLSLDEEELETGLINLKVASRVVAAGNESMNTLFLVSVLFDSLAVALGVTRTRIEEDSCVVDAEARGLSAHLPPLKRRE